MVSELPLSKCYVAVFPLQGGRGGIAAFSWEAMEFRF